MRFAVVMFWALIGPLGAAAEEQPRQISVHGEGVVRAEPDMAIINLGVMRDARTAAAAMDAASAAMAQVLEVVAAAGVAPADVQTSSVNLSPRWDHSKDGPPHVAGYIASNDLTLRVRSLDNLPVVLDAVVGTGANTMNGLSLTVAEPGSLEDEALVRAMQDARAKAELLAGAASVTLGPVVSILEGGGPAAPVPMLRGAAMEQSMAVPIARGEVDYRASVAVVFELVTQ